MIEGRHAAAKAQWHETFTGERCSEFEVWGAAIGTGIDIEHADFVHLLFIEQPNNVERVAYISPLPKADGFNHAPRSVD